jgi:predicted alpha/beta-hydrolase family hydrolase
VPDDLRIAVNATSSVSALLMRPADAHALLVLAHGAGGDMRQAFLERISGELGDVGIATLRYNFVYTEAGRGRPDPPALLTATVRAAVDAARAAAPDLPLFAGGKSMGGRMTSQAAAQGKLPDVRGLIFFGFPLHPPGQPGISRADHLDAVTAPMLFLQGTRDDFADLELLRPVCDRLGTRATLHIVDGADHSFHVLKRSGRDDAAVRGELVETVRGWMLDVRR